MTGSAPETKSPAWRAISAVGHQVNRRRHQLVALALFVGGLTRLLGQTFHWCVRGVVAPRGRLGRTELLRQMVRVGVRSIGIVVLVQVFIGIIVALQLAPTLQQYGQIERVADVVGIAIVRELGPLITAIVLSGFAGASIAAEIGSMVEGEEIKALRAHAMNPIRFLVVPRFVATLVMLTGLTVIADVVGVAGGLFTAISILGIPFDVYVDYTQRALSLSDFYGGLTKAVVFGATISMIACYEGLHVRGGAEGVGRAATATVVKSIVALIGIDVVFTVVFYVFEI